MNWFLWFLAAWFLANAVLIVAGVGKVRKATTPGTAAVAILIDTALIAGLFVFGAK